MAYDNIMGVAGAAHWHVSLMILDLADSIPVLVPGARWLVTMMNRYPRTGELAALVPLYLAAAVFIRG